MEQMYLIEIFVDKVTIIVAEGEVSSANKKLIVKINFGPKVQFIVKEGQLAVNEKTKDDVVECDANGRRKWSRTIRVGKSYLFPSYPDTLMSILSKFPLQIEVWNDDETETEIFVGVGTMIWDTQFFQMLKEATDPNKLYEPLTIKQNTVLTGECCCGQVGEITFILRLSAIGDSIVTEFQQLMKTPDAFVFRTNKAPSMFQCTRVEGDDPNFCMVGSLYETTTLEDPDVVNNATKQIEICTELQSCGVAGNGQVCQHSSNKDEKKKKQYAVDRIRMGDITGPCGNANCPLAHKVRTYIRTLDTYKKEAEGKVKGTKPTDASKNVCGTCGCADDRYHRDGCPDKDKQKAVCSGCGGVTKSGETCQERENKLQGTGATPKGSKTTIAYLYDIFKDDKFQPAYGRNFIVENLAADYCEYDPLQQSGSEPACGCRRPMPPVSSVITSNPNVSPLQQPRSNPLVPNAQIGGELSQSQVVYNVHHVGAKASQSHAVFNCSDINEDCKCDPPKPTPPCYTFDCECMTEIEEMAARKAHKPYCPSYKHKERCPVTLMLHHEDDENLNKKKGEDDDDDNDPLPYGLPPIKLGPCPVLGRPCTAPEGFTRMYKTAAMTPAPPSYSDAGKVCCSKDYERIKKAVKEYLKKETENDFRCINQFNVDTEKRCCDKEQRLRALEGKGCCGTHKTFQRQ